MAIKLARVRDRIRIKLKDYAAQVYDSMEIDQAVAESYLWLQSRLPSASLETSSALTISAETFTLPTIVTQWTGNDGQAEYTGDVRIRLRSTGMFLRKVSVEELNAYRNGQPNASPGQPWRFCLWEDKTQAVQGRVYPGPGNAEVCDLFVRLSADDLRDFVGSGTSGMDEVSLQASRQAVTGLVFHVSAELLAAMSDEDAAVLKLDKSVAELWLKKAEDLIYLDGSRHDDVEATGRSMRWVP